MAADRTFGADHAHNGLPLRTARLGAESKTSDDTYPAQEDLRQPQRPADQALHACGPGHQCAGAADRSLERRGTARQDRRVQAQRLVKGETLDDLLPEAFAVVREAGKRTLNMRHFDVQLIGGMVLHYGKIAEMRTGEGKTLVATLPAYLNALGRRPACTLSR